MKHMNIETPVNEPKSKSPKDINLLIELLVVAAFYPNYFYKFHNPEREPEANRSSLLCLKELSHISTTTTTFASQQKFPGGRGG